MNNPILNIMYLKCHFSFFPDLSSLSSAMFNVSLPPTSPQQQQEGKDKPTNASQYGSVFCYSSGFLNDSLSRIVFGCDRLSLQLKRGPRRACLSVPTQDGCPILFQYFCKKKHIQSLFITFFYFKKKSNLNILKM